MLKTKRKYLTAKEMGQLVREGKNLPIAVFSAQKTDYIVKPRGTIFGIRKKKGHVKW